jgi:hypothetical protein
MNRIVSVDKSLLTNGNIVWFVTMADTTGKHTRIEVREEEAKRFKNMIESQKFGGNTLRVLTETLP